MRLFLHIGTEKTGSSYLQKICAHNRDLLVRHGIWFPKAGKHEERLMHGNISSGNAFALSQRINSGDWANVRTWISERLQEAVKRGCNATLLSNEILCSVLASGDSVSRLNVAAREAGADEVDALLVIRDPIEQALSLYKHRAKNGLIGDIDDWMNSSFDLPERIGSLLRQLEAAPINACIRKYTKDGVALKRIFFADWLGLPELPHSPVDIVNPSLTLSELRVLQSVAATRPDSVPLFYKELLAVPTKDKADDRGLESVCKELLSRHLCRFEPTWRELASRLRADGGLSVPAPSGETLSGRSLYIFEQAQLDAFARAHNKSLRMRTQLLGFFRKRFRRPLGRIWYKLRDGN